MHTFEKISSLIKAAFLKSVMSTVRYWSESPVTMILVKDFSNGGERPSVVARLASGSDGVVVVGD